MGTLSQPKDIKPQPKFEHKLDFYKQLPSASDLVFHPVRELHGALRGLLKAHGTLAIRDDDWPYWVSKGEARESGKLFFIDPTDIDAHEIFFDDNIGNGKLQDAHIVDTQDATTGVHLPDEVTTGQYINKASALGAIRDPHYFVKLISQSERRRAALR